MLVSVRKVRCKGMEIKAEPAELIVLIKGLQEQSKPHVYEDGSGYKSYTKDEPSVSRTSCECNPTHLQQANPDNRLLP